MSPSRSASRLERMGTCVHPPERLEKTFGLRQLPSCLDCGRQMCHACLVVHTGPCRSDDAVREFADAAEAEVERLRAEVARLRVAVAEARYYVARCNQIEGTDESRRWLLNNPGRQA